MKSLQVTCEDFTEYILFLILNTKLKRRGSSPHPRVCKSLEMSSDASLQQELQYPSIVSVYNVSILNKLILLIEESISSRRGPSK